MEKLVMFGPEGLLNLLENNHGPCKQCGGELTGFNPCEDENGQQWLVCDDCAKYNEAEANRLEALAEAEADEE